VVHESPGRIAPRLVVRRHRYRSPRKERHAAADFPGNRELVIGGPKRASTERIGS
jgi:hypothetical protein